MITLSPDEVKQRFGPLFAQKFLVMVDERAGAAEIHEQCRVRGTIEWDAMNRRRAGGAVSTCEDRRDFHDHPGPAGEIPGEFRFGCG